MHKIYPKTLFVGQIINYLPSCQSTNDEAADLIAQRDPSEGTLVVTDHQTAGRGQRGNVWQARPGQNLTFSLILKPTFLRATDQFWLNMAISLGIIDVLQPSISGTVCIKWPNDIYVNDQKMGGILIENTLHGYGIAWSVAGIGLNVNQADFEYPTATSMQQQAPLANGYDLPGLLRSGCECIEQRYLQLRAGRRDEMKADYLARLYRYRQVHTFESGERTFQGQITGVDPLGRLSTLR